MFSSFKVSSLPPCQQEASWEQRAKSQPDVWPPPLPRTPSPPPSAQPGAGENVAGTSSARFRLIDIRWSPARAASAGAAVRAPAGAPPAPRVSREQPFGEPSMTRDRRAGWRRPGAAGGGDGPSGGGRARWGSRRRAPHASGRVAGTGGESPGVPSACAVGRFRARLGVTRLTRCAHASPARPALRRHCPFAA